MEVQFGPNPVDEPNLLYKLQRKFKVFNTENALPNRGYNLVTNSSKYGLVFVGAPDGTLLVYHLKELIDKDCDPKHFAVKLQEKPTHVAVSCDQELLATTGGQLLSVYKVADFQNVNVSPAVTIKLDVNPSTFVSALQWNPCIPDNIAIAFFDGTLLVSSVSNSQVKKVQSKARCICWSPKGKQLVTGNSDGSLCQYKPDLTPAKTVPPPNLFEGAPVEALAIYWISTFQFAVVFRNASDNSRPVVTIVNTPKAGHPSCFNYEDICYSMGSNRPWYYYLQGIAQWNVILASSSNSMEIATLGSADGSNWTQWCQSDEARPELPLTNKKIENYPVGICIDTCGIHQLPWGENETLPHMPMLHVVSQSGLLTIFNIINMKAEGANLCTPPQQLTLLTLPASAMTSVIPGEAPVEVTLPAPPSATVKPQPHPAPAPQPAQPAQSAFSTGGQLSSMFGQAKPQFGTQSQFAQAFAAASTTQASEPPKPVEVKPAPAQQPQPAAAQPKPQAKPPASQATEVNAALKAEQERMTKLKADQELKNMLVKEVNDFQMELHKFVVRTKEVQNKLQQDLNALEPNFHFQSFDTEQLKKECDLEDLRGAIMQLKLELVRTCAVVAEARTHAEAKDLHQWSQVDPLTSKRVASVKNLAYYVQSELEKAHKALDYKWNEMLARDPQYNKPGQRMIRPILDDVYQPLVKQQEILSRQQAVLRQLKNTLKEVDAAPMFKSTSLLRSTPFRNKDPLSKLTKNILNMSIEPQNKTKDALFTPQKLDALRDMLSNHKPTKIKPVNVELRQHLAQMRINYEKSVKEKVQQESLKQVVKTEPVVPPQPTQIMKHIQPAKPAVQPIVQPSLPAMANIVKPDLISKPTPAISIPSFTPVNQTAKPGLNNVARTLFSDEKTTAPQQPKAPQPQIKPPTQPQPALGFAPPTSITASANTRSILKDMLQNKQANSEAKSDANTFMGQKICSPSAFAFSSVPSATTQAPTLTFTSKPISDISNMFSKFTPQSFAPESKPQVIAPKAQLDETSKTQIPDPKPIETKKEETASSVFQMKVPPPVAASTPNVPDVLKTNSQAAVKVEKHVPKAEKVVEISKENVPEKAAENVVPSVQKKAEADKKENVPKPFSFSTGKPATSLFGTTSTPFATSANVTPTELPKPAETKTVSKPESKTEAKPEVKTEAKSEVKPEAKPEAKSEVKPEAKPETKPETPTIEKSEAPVPSSNASSLFAAANAASPPASTPQSGFGTPTSTPQSPLFGSPKPPATTAESTPTATTSASSLFASAAASQPFAKTTQAGSIFSGSSSPSSVFGATQGSIFETTATTTQSSSSVFGTSTAQSAFSGGEAKPTAFSVPMPASPAAVFASAAAATTPPVQSAFGSPSGSIFASTSPTTSPSSVFGSGSAFGTAATTASVFATSTTSQSVFGTATTTTPSVFGAASSSSIFGSAAAATPSSVFGGAATTTQSVFGTTPTTQAASIFGGATTTQSSIFGATTPTTQASVFGATSQTSVFGSPTPSTQASVFGTPTQTTQASVFGSQPATTASGSLFGGSENLFAAASISTTSAGSPASGGSIFGGGGGSSGSIFGTGDNSTNVFGSKTAFNQANPQAAAIFGGGAAFAQKPATATNFWSGGGATTGGSAFGSTGFGQQATTQASSIFGGGTGGSFSSPSGGNAFGSPTQQSSVFGAPQQQTAPGFGGSPVFGAKPAFGQPAAFGSPPSGGSRFGAFSSGFNKSPSSGFGAPAAFGGPPAFGAPAFGSTSPGKMFGGTSPAPSFASTQSNATFESLATQNTLTFGNLAQQTTQQPTPAPSFNASPSFTGWRG